MSRSARHRPRPTRPTWLRSARRPPLRRRPTRRPWSSRRSKVRLYFNSPHHTSHQLTLIHLTLQHLTPHTDDEAKAKAEKAKEDFANSPEGKAHAKDIQDKEAEIAARELKKKDEERAEDLARLAQLRKEKKEEEAKAKAEEEKKRKSGGKFRREDPEDDDSGAGGGGGGGGGKSKKGKKN